MCGGGVWITTSIINVYLRVVFNIRYGQGDGVHKEDAGCSTDNGRNHLS
jgi:hypothetical protein